ncbi:hypothetical protein K353_02256 [Kitasatospora sp. SolWspMP-SS2h]|nr:hypothetical protein K353_02256 [Kitasatospora sp. SolWspMP-SS2h]
MPTVLGIALLAPAVLGTWTSGAGTTRGGEVHNELRLNVSTNAGTDPGVRLRAGEPATRTYHLSNHAEYPLGSVVLSDPQLPGGRLSCGADRSIPPGGTLDCTATFTVAAGPQTAQVAAVAEAPDHLPQAHTETLTGYLGIAAGIRLTRVGTPGGTGLSRRFAPRTPPSDLRGSILESTRASVLGSTAESATGTASGPTTGAATRPATRAVAGVGGTVELQYRLEAFGDVPITAASVTEGLPGLGTVDCAGPDGGHTLPPGQAVDCRATGTARPGRQTGTARAVGLADDATVGPDGNRQAPRQVSAEADGAYDGLRPTPSNPEPTEPAPVGQGVGSGSGAGPGTVPGSGPVTGPGAGAGQGQGQGQGQAGGVAAGAGPAAPGATGTGGTAATGTAPALSNDTVPPGLFPVSVPPGTRPEAAAVGKQPGVAGQAQPAAGAPVLAGQLLVPFLPGQAPVLLPGGTAFASPALPFAAPGRSGAANPFSGNPAASTTDSRIASALASSSALASTPVSGPSREPDRASGTAAGRQPSTPATGRSPGVQAQSQFAEEDWPRGGEDDTWDGAEVMMLLLAVLLPVLCVLAAAFTTPNRGRRGRP